MTKEPYYITTAISYVNGNPHLGHAYEAIMTDAQARFRRLDGHDVFFLTGTDEHGEKVYKTAVQNGMEAQDFTDKIAGIFRSLTKTLNISNDDFIRTTEKRHHKAAQTIWSKLEARGDIYLDQYDGWYSVREEGYFGENEIVNDPETGNKLSPNGTEVNWVEEPSFFFKLSEYQDKLLQLYEENPAFIQPESRRNEVISFVKSGLKDLSISRHKKRLHWGVPVPDHDDHVMYVWLDALTNYITGIGYPEEDKDSFKKFWPADCHVIGKDIIRFHTVYWPAFLMSAGLPLPKSIFAHGFINVEGVKMSKSVGNVLAPDNLIEIYGLDALRYLLLREIPHGQDGNFSHEHAVQRINADLANGLGNLVQRVLSMVFKNCEEQIPDPGPLNQDDEALLENAYAMPDIIRPHMDKFAFHRALEEIMRVVGQANGYMDAQAPWKLKQDDPERMQTVLYVLSETIRTLGIISQPFMPDSAAKILDQLKIKTDQRAFLNIDKTYRLESGAKIDKPEGIFPRIELEEDRDKKVG